jgi:hypothetical protein
MARQVPENPPPMMAMVGVRSGGVWVAAADAPWLKPFMAPVSEAGGHGVDCLAVSIR